MDQSDLWRTKGHMSHRLDPLLFLGRSRAGSALAGVGRVVGSLMEPQAGVTQARAEASRCF